MTEQVISFKYDGDSAAIKNHEIDIRVLAKALDSFADLIVSADVAINKQASDARVLVRASDGERSGFVAGSFGVELLVFVDPEVLKALGFVAAGAGGSLLSVLSGVKNKKLETIEVDENSDLAKIVLADKSVIETSPAVASLVESPDVRREIAKLIHEPLSGEGISSFKVFEGPLPEGGEAEKPQFEVTDVSKEVFRRPAKIMITERRELETTAVIEFEAANKKSGNSGWRMKHLSDESVAVKIEDEAFMERIKNTVGAPKIFAEKFSVKLKTVTVFKHGDVVSESYTILKVIGPKKH